MLGLGKKILNRGVGQMVRKIKSKDKKQELKADKKQALTEHREILKEREQSRQDLGITQEEEKRLFKYIRLNRGKGLSEKELFFKALDIITEEKKEREQQQEKKKLEKIRSLALEQTRKGKKKKLADIKTTVYSLKLTDKEKQLMDILKSEGVDIPKLLKKALYGANRKITREIMGGDIKYHQARLKAIIKDIARLEREQQEKRQQRNKTDDLLLEIEKGKYLLAELRRDRKRTEKYLNELKELI